MTRHAKSNAVVLGARRETPHGPVEVSIHTNEEPTCAHCGVRITRDNDSGWEAFTGKAPGETQPVCEACNEPPLTLTKAEDDLL